MNNLITVQVFGVSTIHPEILSFGQFLPSLIILDTFLKAKMPCIKDTVNRCLKSAKSSRRR